MRPLAFWANEVVPRSVERIYEQIAGSVDEWRITLTFVELYNDGWRDLLAASSRPGDSRRRASRGPTVAILGVGVPPLGRQSGARSLAWGILAAWLPRAGSGGLGVHEVRVAHENPRQGVEAVSRAGDVPKPRCPQEVPLAVMVDMRRLM